MKPSNFFSKKQEIQILNAIRDAELFSTGEIKIHIESKCDTDPVYRAKHIFYELGVHETDEKNGVLLYLAIDDKKFAIIGDKGINEKVPDNFWDDVKETIFESFRKNNYTQGLTEGILSVGRKLSEYFPYHSEDLNELSNEISYYDN